MAAQLDVCRFVPTAGGTTDWTFSSAIVGYQSPSAAGVVNGTKYKYRAESADLSQWEIGEGSYNTSTGVLSRTTVLFNSSGGTSKINFTATPQVAIVLLKEDLISVEEANSFTTTQKAQAQNNIAVPPTIQSLTSGTSATYTTGTQGGQRATWIEVFMVGGGGGGGGAVNGSGAGTVGSDGTASSFNGITAAPGKGAGIPASAVGLMGAGGAGGTGGTGTATRRMPGQSGQSGGNMNTATLPSTMGGSSVLFGGGAAPVIDTGTHFAPGNAGATNTGGGGSGALDIRTTNNNTASAGGAGESVYLLISSPAASYTYTIGAGGAGGVSTTNGGAGGSGFIQVIEHYGS